MDGARMKLKLFEPAATLGLKITRIRYECIGDTKKL